MDINLDGLPDSCSAKEIQDKIMKTKTEDIPVCKKGRAHKKFIAEMILRDAHIRKSDAAKSGWKKRKK